MYPYSMTATAVLDALRMHLGSAEELCGQTVTDLVPYKDGWRVQADHGIMTADSVIFAAGGHAAPKHGTDGSAWRLLEQLDIPIIPPRAGRSVTRRAFPAYSWCSRA